LNDNLDQINSLPFYLIENEQLILPPFQPHPPSLHIPIPKPLSPTPLPQHKTHLLKHLHPFPPHIASHPNTKSQILIPIHLNHQIIRVLHIHPPITHPFTNQHNQ
ncbi:GAF domain-containing protein, partial [Staphylococcus haemolyticus]|uniref:GAF domain-containing protein n=1 Tax=Staphylococcus haemolyticus TaxID=1283 RepID=UPI001C92CC03